jgi:hypothetical protein
MLRRLIVLTALAAGMSIAAAMTLATPALAKGPSQARITGPGLARAIVVSGPGEPGQQGRLATLAGQTSLFTVLFGAGGSVPKPARLRTPPPKATLGPRYTIIYTVPGVTPQPGEEFGRIRQDLYPQAAGGPVIYTPPGQHGFGQPLRATGWLRGSAQLTTPLPSSAFHHDRARSQRGKPTSPLPHIQRQHIKPALGPLAGLSHWLRPSQPRLSPAPCCGCVTASHPPCMTANPGPAGRFFVHVDGRTVSDPGAGRPARSLRTTGSSVTEPLAPPAPRRPTRMPTRVSTSRRPAAGNTGLLDAVRSRNGGCRPA